MDKKKQDIDEAFMRKALAEDGFNLVMNDIEHDYVEVSFADIDYKMCEPDQTDVRVKLKNPIMTDEPSDDNLWAFAGCK